jgi:AraC-like DNA-binding protein
MKSDFSEINDFFKQLADFRESTNIADFFFLPHIVHANRVQAKDESEKHIQRTFEIALLLAGKMIYVIKDKEVSLQRGDVIIIPPNMKHYWRVLEEESDVFSFMVNISKHGDGARRDLASLNNSIKNHNYHIKSFGSFENIIRQVINEIVEQETACKEKVIYLIRIAFIELIRKLLPHFSQSVSPRNFPPVRGENKKDIVEIVHYYIQDNMDRPISLSEISNHIGLSIGHLNYLFKSEAKITINQAIINKRLEWACRYLKQTDRQIKDIATLVGYNDVNYFYLQFKKKYGITPSEYRKNKD